VKRLHVELIVALQFDETHCKLRRCLRDPLGVAIVVLVRLDIRANVFGRHQPDVVTEGGKRPAEMRAQHASILTTHAGSFSATPFNVS
jgi:hypothetical protein